MGTNDSMTTDQPGTYGFSPCPGCGEVGFSIQAWSGERTPENQLMQCDEDDCRVDEYFQITEE